MPGRSWTHLLHRAAARTLALSLLGLTALAAAPAAADTDPGDHVPDELLVGFHDHVGSDRAEAIYQAEGAARLEKLLRLNVHRIRLAPAALAAAEKRLRSWPEVAFVERNRRIPIALVPNDPSYVVQWHLPAIGAPQAWDLTTGSPDIVIGILDTGVDPTHPDLEAKLVPGWNFYNNNSNTADAHGHGTLVAGAAAAIGNNGVGVTGVAMASRIMPLRVSDPAGYAYYSTISNALTWAADRGARVMNVSFSGVAGSNAIRSAAKYVRSRGGVVVASAGNCGCVDQTADAVEIISVSSTSTSDGLSSFSSRGPYVDLAAPGEAIRTTARGGGYASAAGTSFSSPIAAGVVALMMAANPGLGASQIEQLLKANADDLGPTGWDPGYGFGRVNAYRAVAAASGSPAPDTAAPAVSITSPVSGAILSGTVAVAVSASDNVGVTRVELWVGGSLAATRTSAPWTLGWNSTTGPNGPQTLVARAYDAAGNAGTSAAVSVSVSNPVPDTTPPSVSITSPASGSTVSGSVAVTAAASDNVGVTRVELWVGGSLVSSRTAAPWSFSWNSASRPNGSHTLTVRAHDAAGNVASASVPVQVANGSGGYSRSPGSTDPGVSPRSPSPGYAGPEPSKPAPKPQPRPGRRY